METDLELARVDKARYRYLSSLMCGDPETIEGHICIRWNLPLGILSERTTLAAAIDAARGGS